MMIGQLSYKGHVVLAVVVAQLEKGSLLTPEVRSLNPNIGKVFIE